VSAPAWLPRSIVGRLLLVAIALGAVFGAVLWIIGVDAHRSAPVRPYDLHEGECLRDNAEDALPEFVRPVSCNRPHFGEVYAVLTLPDVARYPTARAMQAFSERCGSKFFDYAPNAPDGPTFRVAVGYPTAQTWLAGDRSVVCVAMAKHERSQSIQG
jgi:hypothetical protein